MGKNKEITTKKNKSTKKVSKKGNSKSTKNKKGNKKFIIKLIFGLLSVLIITFGIITFYVSRKEEIIITIDNIEYSESDFNMYAYLVKYDYFGIDGTDLDESTLNIQVSNDSEKTVGEYLKEQTISKIKVSASILRIAKENNITLNNNDLKEIEDGLQKFIKNLGGETKFRELLKKNDTNEKSYIEVAKINKLYDKIYEFLYDEGKRNDLNYEELTNYTKLYNDEYVKIKQIVLLKKDLDKNTYLSEAVINQKEKLAEDLVKQLKDAKNIDDFIIKYSEGYEDSVKSEYYLKTELVEELKKAINSLKVGEISNVVSSEAAYHIIIREELDEAKLEDFLDSKREEKFIKNISDNLKKIVIINGDYLEKITVK